MIERSRKTELRPRYLAEGFYSESEESDGWGSVLDLMSCGIVPVSFRLCYGYRKCISLVSFLNLRVRLSSIRVEVYLFQSDSSEIKARTSIRCLLQSSFAAAQLLPGLRVHLLFIWQMKDGAITCRHDTDDEIENQDPMPLASRIDVQKSPAE